jgi:hypothetical protein
MKRTRFYPMIRWSRSSGRPLPSELVLQEPDADDRLVPIASKNPSADRSAIAPRMRHDETAYGAAGAKISGTI